MANPRNPLTIDDLFEFYYQWVKPLYSEVQAYNVLPSETLFEINAAFDHLSRKWEYGETEDHVVAKAIGHLKRSCLDIFKIMVRETVDAFNELRTIDTSVIDNGDYDHRLRKLISNIRTGAVNARSLEGNGSEDLFPEVKAFDAWIPVHENCVLLLRDFWLHPEVPWARRRQKTRATKRLVVSIVIAFFVGVASSLGATYLWSKYTPGHLSPTPKAVEGFNTPDAISSHEASNP